MTPAKTLVLIGGFLALMIGSFIWFVATWDRTSEDPVSNLSLLVERVQA